MRIALGLIFLLSCICWQAAAQEQAKMTVTGKLIRVAAIGGESTGWAIQLDSEITIDGKRVNSVEIDYHETSKLEKLENKRVRASGKPSHRHGVETGDRPVLEVSSIREVRRK
ncbi:MAG TPA: hypothetical protein VGR97_14685 [Candidatus Acidoferrales bacterium]|nr:hypothetical protein [Candidatus Acidoferrales bacterium]